MEVLNKLTKLNKFTKAVNLPIETFTITEAVSLLKDVEQIIRHHKNINEK